MLAAGYSDLNNDEVTIEDFRLNLSIEIDVGILGVDLNNQREASWPTGRVDRLVSFPPPRNGVNSNQIAPRKIRSTTGQLINLDRADISSVAPKRPAIGLIYSGQPGPSRRCTNAGYELLLVFIRPV